MHVIQYLVKNAVQFTTEIHIRLRLYTLAMNSGTIIICIRQIVSGQTEVVLTLVYYMYVRVYMYRTTKQVTYMYTLQLEMARFCW